MATTSDELDEISQLISKALYGKPSKDISLLQGIKVIDLVKRLESPLLQWRDSEVKKELKSLSTRRRELAVIHPCDSDIATEGRVEAVPVRFIIARVSELNKQEKQSE